MMKFRELFNRDFGIDLPIGGGEGTRSNPVVFDQVATVEEAAVLTETVLKLYHQGRATSCGPEIFWKIIGSGPTTSKQQRYSIARVLIEKDEVITERASYYFVAPATNHGVWPRAVAASETAQGFSFPLKLGWLDHIRRHDYEADAPGMGYSHHYGATGVDYTVYVYKGGRNAHSGVEWAAAVEEQVELGIAGVAQHRGGIDSVHRQGIPQLLSSDTRGAFFLEGPERQQSLLVVDHKDGTFVKVRATWKSGDMAGKHFDFVMETLAKTGTDILATSRSWGVH
ncbi:MAG: hypothetical protein EOS61_10450 [Mesorhizobium sp.]|nr:MAG: hypothetical protein EOS61_10450 [Mesorhizobium sp.]